MLSNKTIIIKELESDNLCYKLSAYVETPRGLCFNKHHIQSLLHFTLSKPQYSHHTHLPILRLLY